MQNEAEVKFWETPELVEKILPFLDLEATKRLAQAHGLTRRILQGKLAGSKLIRRSCHDLEVEGEAKVRNLIEILKLLEKPKAHLPTLLDVICERQLIAGSTEFIQMGCDHHPDSHQIAPRIFKLLEEVEGAFGTTEQTVEMVKIRWMEDAILSSLASRMARQRRKIGTLHAHRISVDDQKSAEAFMKVIEASQGHGVVIHYLRVDGAIGKQGWKSVAKGLQMCHGVEHFYTLKEATEGGDREDFRKIWESLSILWSMRDKDDAHFEGFYKANGEADWARLEAVLDMSLEEWIGQKELDEQEQGDEEEDEEEGEGGLEQGEDD